MNELNLNKAQQAAWIIGTWTYWPSSGCLKNSSTEHRLSSQLNEVFLMLVENAPDVVTRAQFLGQVWRNKYVNEDALSRTVAELRKVLGDSASQARYIKTIPKIGYQLMQTVEPVTVRKTRRIKLLLSTVSLLCMCLFAYFWSQRVPLLVILKDAMANASRLTAEPGMEQQSILSSDGQWLSYVSLAENNNQIVIRSLTDTNNYKTVKLAQHQLSSPIYLPEQNLLLFVARDEKNCSIKSHHLIEKQFKDLGSCDFDVESRVLDWNPVTQQLLFADNDLNSQGGNFVSIYQMDLQSNKKVKLTSPPTSDTRDWSPRISPNQSYLSFTRGNQSVRNLWLKDLSSGEETPLTTGKHYSVSHDWFDDEHIVFDSDLSGSRQLWLLNIYEKQPNLLGANGAQHASFDFNRRIMTYQEVNYEANIWLLDVNDQKFERIVHSTKYDNYPEFSHDGQQFLFSTNRQGQSTIWLYDMQSKSERLMVAVKDAKLTRPSWHSNGKQLLMTINDDRGYGTLLYDLETGNTKELDFGQGHLGTIEYQGEYFALATSAALNNKILHAVNGVVNELEVDAVARFMLLSDGRLVNSKTNQNGLFVYDLNSAKEVLITPDLDSSAVNLWTVVNQAVYYDYNGVNKNKPAGVWRIDINSQEQKFITPYRPYSVGTALSVNQDETQLLMSRTDRAESDVFMARIN